MFSSMTWAMAVDVFTCSNSLTSWQFVVFSIYVATKKWKKSSTYSWVWGLLRWFREEYTWRIETRLFMFRKPGSSTTFFINKSIKPTCRKVRFSNNMRRKRTLKKKKWIEEELFNNYGMLLIIYLDLKKFKQQ